MNLGHTEEGYAIQSETLLPCGCIVQVVENQDGNDPLPWKLQFVYAESCEKYHG